MLEVVDRSDDRRYELLVDDEMVSFAPYRLEDDVMVIPHVETRPEHRGNGFADMLITRIVDDARTRELTIRPLCSYAASVMHGDPSMHDVIAR